MDIQVAIISALTAQCELVDKVLASSPGVVVVFAGHEARDLRAQAVWPDVVVFGLREVPKPTRSADWWRDIAWLRRAAPRAHICLWFQDAEPEVLQAVSAAGVKGIVQWGDATTASWATMVRVVHSGGSYWSRPFDVVGRWNRESSDWTTQSDVGPS